MSHLYLLRHGDYLYEPAGESGFKQDCGLTDLGREQAERLRLRLATTGELRPDVFLSSSERRARETAEIIAPVLGTPIIIDPDLEEWRSDDSSVETEEFMRQWHALSDRERRFHRFVPGCETGIEFSTRVHSTLNRILQAHRGKTIVLMTHGGVIQVAFQFFFGYGEAAFRRAYPAAAHVSITHWRHEEGPDRWVLEGANDHRHG